MSVDYEPIGPLMEQIRQVVDDNLVPTPGLSTVVPGNTVAWDNCCEGGGELWVRVISIVGAAAMSRPALQPCYPLYQVRIGVGVIRCAHTLDNQGYAPTAEEMTADANQAYLDRANIVQALACTVAKIEGIETLRIEDWLPLGPEGGCAGGEQTATFNYIACVPCAE